MWQIWEILVLCLVPALGCLMYFGTHMYTSDQIDDMEERGEITWIQHTILYEKMQMGEYKLYPKFIQKLTNKEEKEQ